MEKTVELGTLISPAKTVRCGNGNYPVLSMTMHNGLVFQDEKFKKAIASKDTSDYKVVYRNQLVISFPIDEGVLAAQRIVDAGIVSPAYGVWDIDQTQVLPEYLEYALRCDRAIQYYKAKLRGSTARRRSLPTPTLLAFTIPLPAIEEQESILDRLHAAKTIIEKRETQIRTLSNLIKARFVEMFENRYPIVILGDVIKTTSGGTPSKAHPEYYDGGSIPWLTSGEVNAGVITTIKNYITVDGMRNSSAKMIPSNSVVVAMYGATAGVTGLLKVQSTTNQAVCSLLPTEHFVPEYLYYAVASKKEWMISQCQGGGQPNISQGIIKRMELIDAPISVQKQFADFVTQVDKSKVVVQKALDEAQLLFDSLMQEYFG